MRSGLFRHGRNQSLLDLGQVSGSHNNGILNARVTTSGFYYWVVFIDVGVTNDVELNRHVDFGINERI
jgi:hypothetical protein